MFKRTELMIEKNVTEVIIIKKEKDIVECVNDSLF